MPNVISLQALTTVDQWRVCVNEVVHYWALNKYTDNRGDNRRLIVLLSYKKGVRGNGWMGDKYFQIATSINPRSAERCNTLSIRQLCGANAGQETAVRRTSYTLQRDDVQRFSLHKSIQ